MRYSYLLLLICLFACGTRNEADINILPWKLTDYNISYYDTITGQKVYEERPVRLQEYDNIVIVNGEIQFVNRDQPKKANHIKTLNNEPALLSFTTYAQPSGVWLEWTTAVEYGVSYYDIYRSRDEKEYVFLGRVPVGGTSTSPNHYVYVDKNPEPGINYYKMCSVSDSGKNIAYNMIAANYVVNPHKLITDGENTYLPFAIDNFRSVRIIYKNDNEMLWQGMERDGKFLDDHQVEKTVNKKLEMKFTR